MLMMMRALLVLSLAMLLHANRKGQSVFMKLEQETGQKSQMVRLILDGTLHPQIASMSASTIANMSLSPWTYRDSCDETRLPRRISHAQCLSSSCLNPQGGGEDMALEAKPIYYQVLVLHKVQRQRRNNIKGGRKKYKYDFRLGTEVITVGCTCVRPSLIPQQ
ncbi:hypothetical protein LDENG_00200230 [Lucifuga dentata]|nr:hypothetical protein LDENG_00200230 [Lucifuga dentata]